MCVFVYLNSRVAVCFVQLLILHHNSCRFLRYFFVCNLITYFYRDLLVLVCMYAIVMFLDKFGSAAIVLNIFIWMCFKVVFSGIWAGFIYRMKHPEV